MNQNFKTRIVKKIRGVILSTMLLLGILICSHNDLYAQAGSIEDVIKTRDKPRLQNVYGIKRILPVNPDSVRLVQNSGDSQTPTRLKVSLGNGIVITTMDSTKAETQQAIGVTKTPPGNWKRIYTSNDKKHED